MLVLPPCESHGQGPPGPWAAAEPVWPQDPIGRLWQARLQMAENAVESPLWPVTLGTICLDLQTDAVTERNANEVSKILTSICQVRNAAQPFSLSLDLGAYPIGNRYPLGEPFETFTSGWGSQRVVPENGKAWTEIPAAVNTELRYPVTSRAFLYFRLGLRRDYAAWQQDAMGLNLPLSDKDVDLNEPSLGYFHAENAAFAFTVGRFPVHWSPSPDFGLALSSAVPFHNGAEFALKMPHVRYLFLVSSLNPWLEGTPSGDTSSENYPAGSEQYRQRHYPSDHGSGNFHNRVYADNIKTLFAHRLEGGWGPLTLGLAETQVIGGKIPDLRDAGPFVFFHNDFKDGYTNGSVSLDAALRLPACVSLAGELYLDDVQYSDTEGEGNTASLLGYLIAVRHAFSARGWGFLHGLHVIRTDPFLYGYQLPLSSMASRHILASNYQHEGDSIFVDRYVVDYPIGYLRGGDAFDFWYRMEAWRGPMRLAFSAAWLAHGPVDLYTPYEEYYQSEHDSPTGVAERELRLGLEGACRLGRGLGVRAGLEARGLWNRGNVAGDDGRQARLDVSVSWTFPR